MERNLCGYPVLSKARSDVHGVKEEYRVACLIISIRSIKLHQNKHTLYLTALAVCSHYRPVGHGRFVPSFFSNFCFSQADPHYRNMTWCALTSSEDFREPASCKSTKRIKNADYTLYGG